MTSEADSRAKKQLTVGIVGCSHGDLDLIYDKVRNNEAESGTKIDLLLCCGDFQAIRNDADLISFHCPQKYKRLGDFHKYYSGEKKAHCLTIFVGGNHESSSFNMELPHGGWVAENIYYMGLASVVNFGGLRIAGWSGIFKHHDYFKNHCEIFPLSEHAKVSVYHVRAIEKFRLGLLADKTPNCVDVFMTHDWPVGITAYGEEKKLMKLKPYFVQDIENNRLGNPYSKELIYAIRPSYWFAAHLHCKFEATVDHEASQECESTSRTQFLALGKNLGQRDMGKFFVTRTIDVDFPMSNELRYDPKWLAILKKTVLLEGIITRSHSEIPANPAEFVPTDEDVQEVERLFNNDFLIPNNFRRTAPPHMSHKLNPRNPIARYYRNPQTKEFCEKLAIADLNERLCLANMGIVGDPDYLDDMESKDAHDEAEIGLDVDLFDDDDIVVDRRPTKRKLSGDSGADTTEKKEQ